MKFLDRCNNWWIHTKNLLRVIGPIVGKAIVVIRATVWLITEIYKIIRHFFL